MYTVQLQASATTYWCQL